MSEAQQIIAIEDISADNAPTIFVAGGLSRFIESVKSEVCGEVPDLTTRKGRERIASLSAMVSKRKTAIEKPGRDYLRHIKTLPKVVEDELREFVTGMNALRDEVRKPLDDWEAADVARRDAHEDRIDWLHNRDDELATLSSEAIEARIAEAEDIEISESWEEFEAEAARVKDKVLATLRAGLATRKTYESEQAELSRLRLEKEARDKKDHEDRIAREAAERATREAEDKARLEREAQEQKARDDQAQSEKRENDLKLQAAESERRAEQAKREKIEAEQKAEQDRIESIEREKQAAENARLEEKARADAAADEILRQQKARQADVAHKSKILGEAKQAIMGVNVSEDLAKAIVLKIARGEVPNITINF